MKKVIITLALSLLVGFSAFAQQYPLLSGSHIYLGARAGAASFGVNGGYFVKPNVPGLNVAADLGYAYFFNQHIGVRTGVQLAYSSSRYKDEIAGTLSGNLDDANGYMLYKYTQHGINEMYSGKYLEVPLQLALQFSHFYANLGVKYAYALSTSASAKHGKLDIENVTSYIGNSRANTLDFDPTNPLFQPNDRGVYSDARYDENTINHNWLFASIDFGYRFGCDCGNSWMLGVYGDLGLNPIQFNNAANAEYLTINDNFPLAPNAYYRNVLTSNLAEKMNLLNVGVKLQYDFGLRKQNK